MHVTSTRIQKISPIGEGQSFAVMECVNVSTITHAVLPDMVEGHNPTGIFRTVALAYIVSYR